MMGALPRYMRGRCYAAKRFLRRVTPLTWLIWAALVSDLCAPGYLVFHLGVTEVSGQAVAAEVLALWKVATNAPEN